MDTPVKNLNKEERENVMMVLNEISTNFSANYKSVAALFESVKELSDKITLVSERPESKESASDAVSKLENLIVTEMEKVSASVHRISVPEDELQELSAQVMKNITLLENPKPQKIVHHHHIPKVIWITASLLVFFAVAAAGWFMTYEKLGSYIASDTKYRFLKLDTSNIYLQNLLYKTDSLSGINSSLRETVISKEEEYRHNFELLQKAKLMNEEAENLKANAKKIKENVGKK